ncbi:MAG: 2-dehydro-3-deoxy-D-arabinonate dehydratase [Microbacteriaceae bacterium]|jgi:2-dehydro-3-deoxy-D-arabinonate dehydratase|nr:2-dehydro-3-deoxy-D-arabinonate dehydratase [Microbacteriaceae bacterium]
MTMSHEFTDSIPSGTLLKGRTAGGRVRWFFQGADGLRDLDSNATLAGLLALSADELEDHLNAATAAAEAPVELLAPLDDHTEVWAAGVTYQASREARMEESREADVYDRVYDAVRPELFFKATGWRVSGHGGPIGIRSDSTVDVPEPEVALVLNSAGTIVGYTVCNDVSSRSIEGENPLYLPQAKIYRHSCSVGPWIRLASAVVNPGDLSITAAVSRDGDVVWTGETTTAKLKRSFEELAEYLFRADVYPFGAVLSTGTSAVPGLDFTLLENDVVSIEVGELGRLSNTVVGV